RDPFLLRGLVEELEDAGVERRATLDRRAAAEDDLALVLVIASADVGRVRHVDGDRDVGLGRERGRPRAGEVADLLLHRRDRDHVAGRAALLPHAARDLEGDVAADPVVERAGGDAVAAERERRAVPDGRVAGPHELAELVRVLRADVEEEIVVVERLAVDPALPLLLPGADDAGERAV